MKQVSLYFKVHQPWRLRRPDDIPLGSENPEEDYFEVDGRDEEIFRKVARKTYYPANDVLRETIEHLEDVGVDFRFAFSLTGTFIEQARKYDPGVLESFRELVDTGNVEILGETYYHSLASLFEDHDEFRDQVDMHRDLVKEEFGVEPAVFVNTEALFNNRIAETVQEMGFDAVKTEGVDHKLGWRSPNHVYETPGGVPVLLRNYRLSDDIGYRFSNEDWDEWPLTADKYAAWLDAADGDVVNIFLDYETFGEHQWPGTGIFSFLKHLPGEVADRGMEFATPSEVVEENSAEGVFDVDPLESVSWADMERDTSAWLGNGMQQHLFEELKWLEPYVKDAGGEELEAWRRLTTSDHLYYMCDKGRGDGDVHSYFSRFDSPEEGYVAYNRALSDLRRKVVG